MRGGMRGSSLSPRPARAGDERPPRPSLALLPSQANSQIHLFLPKYGATPIAPSPEPVVTSPHSPPTGMLRCALGRPHRERAGGCETRSPPIYPTFLGAAPVL